MSRVNFTKEQIASAERLAKELRSEAEVQLTVEENLANSIRMRVQDADAENTVADIKKGIAVFHELYGRAVEKDLSSVVGEEVDKLLADMDETQQRTALTNILKCCHAAVGEEFPEDKEYDLDVLREAVCIYFSEYSLIHMIDEDTLPEELDEEQLQKLAAASEEAYQEEYAAVAMYLLQVTGEVEQIPADLTPSEIGTMTAAGMAASNSYLQAVTGKIDVEQFKKKLKLIAGVAMLALIIVAGWKITKIAVVVSMVSFGALLTKLGVVSKVFTYLAGAVTASEIWDRTEALGKKIAQSTGVAQAVASVREKINSFVTGSLMPRVKGFWEKLGIKQKKPQIIDALPVQQEQDEEEETEQETVEQL